MPSGYGVDYPSGFPAAAGHARHTAAAPGQSEPVPAPQRWPAVRRQTLSLFGDALGELTCAAGACRQSKVTRFKSLRGKSLAVATSSFVFAVAPCCLHV
jgi:hypothetical protein